MAGKFRKLVTLALVFMFVLPALPPFFSDWQPLRMVHADPDLALDGQNQTVGTSGTYITTEITTTAAARIIVMVLAVGQTVISVSDESTLTWNQRVNCSSGTHRMAEWYADASGALTGNLINITLSGATAFADISAFAVTGTNLTFDSHASLPNATAAGYASISTTNSTTFIFGALSMDGNPNDPAANATAGWTGIFTAQASSWFLTEYQNVTTTKSGLLVTASLAPEGSIGCTIGDALTEYITPDTYPHTTFSAGGTNSSQSPVMLNGQRFVVLSNTTGGLPYQGHIRILAMNSSWGYNGTYWDSAFVNATELVVRALPNYSNDTIFIMCQTSDAVNYYPTLITWNMTTGNFTQQFQDIPSYKWVVGIWYVNSEFWYALTYGNNFAHSAPANLSAPANWTYVSLPAFDTIVGGGHEELAMELFLGNFYIMQTSTSSAQHRVYEYFPANNSFVNIASLGANDTTEFYDGNFMYLGVRDGYALQAAIPVGTNLTVEYWTTLTGGTAASAWNKTVSFYENMTQGTNTRGSNPFVWNTQIAMSWRFLNNATQTGITFYNISTGATIQADSYATLGGSFAKVGFPTISNSGGMVYDGDLWVIGSQYPYSPWTDVNVKIWNMSAVTDLVYITFAAGTGGTTNQISGWFNLNVGINVLATNASGYTFLNFVDSVDGNSTNNPYAFTPAENRTITAYFNGSVSLTIIVSTTPIDLANFLFTSSVTYSSPQSFSWAPSSSHTLQALDLTPQGYAFDYWSCTDGTSSNLDKWTKTLGAAAVNFTAHYNAINQGGTGGGGGNQTKPSVIETILTGGGLTILPTDFLIGNEGTGAFYAIQYSVAYVNAYYRSLDPMGRLLFAALLVGLAALIIRTIYVKVTHSRKLKKLKMKAPHVPRIDPKLYWRSL